MSQEEPVEVVDAVVVGAGQNGLVAANTLADAGWDVLVLEADEVPGGAVRSAEVTAPGFSSDLFSAFYPFGAGSPAIDRLHLEEHGLEWVHAPAVLAHSLDDGRAPVLSRDVEATAASVEEFAPGDGDGWRELHARWQVVREPLLRAITTPFPPIRSGADLVRRLGMAGVLDLARFAALPALRVAEENFDGEGGALLIAGNAFHADIPMNAPGSGLLGWLLAMLGQDVGFPVPRGGAQRLADAMVSRLEAAGGRVRTSAPVERVHVIGGRAVGVGLLGGGTVRARRAVLADCDAVLLYRQLVGDGHLPASVLRALGHFQRDHPTVKVDWALSAPLPWTAEGARGAGTVHVGRDLAGLVDLNAKLDTGRDDPHPFLLVGQMTTSDPTRSPEGTESLWAYTHVSRRLPLTDELVAKTVERMEHVLEQHAPGFRDLVLARHVQGPHDLEHRDRSLVHGTINGGTAQLHQELVFRPIPSLGRPETPVERLYLASSSAHPGGGVHGAPGWNAARAALAGDRMPKVLRSLLVRGASLGMVPPYRDR
ncbi:MAG: phytoene desaturase family protein [Motilibacteraceae bacterium]